MSEELRSDFDRLHCEENDCGWCFCAAWWVPSWPEFAEHTAEENRRIREGLFERGEYDGYLLYLDDEPVGWCQIGPRDRLRKLVSQYRLEPDPEAWGITCFVIVPEHRGRGLASKLLAHAIEDVRGRGARRIEAFPRRGDGLPDGDVWTGPESLYRRAGFTVLVDHEQWPVLVLEL